MKKVFLVLIIAILFSWGRLPQSFAQGYSLSKTMDESESIIYKQYNQSVRHQIKQSIWNIIKQNKQEYFNYSNCYNDSDCGYVFVEFGLYPSGDLIDVKVIAEGSTEKFISAAIRSVKESAPFKPFPDIVAKNNKKLYFKVKLVFRKPHKKILVSKS